MKRTHSTQLSYSIAADGTRTRNHVVPSAFVESIHKSSATRIDETFVLYPLSYSPMIEIGLVGLEPTTTRIATL